MSDLLTSNEWRWRLLRTVVQGVLGVVVANMDTLVGCTVLDFAWRTLVFALVMAELSPVMAELDGAVPEGFEPGEDEDFGFEGMPDGV